MVVILNRGTNSLTESLGFGHCNTPKQLKDELLVHLVIPPLPFPSLF